MDHPKEHLKENSEEHPKEHSKEHPKEHSKDHPKERSKTLIPFVSGKIFRTGNEHLKGICFSCVFSWSLSLYFGEIVFWHDGHI